MFRPAQAIFFNDIVKSEILFPWPIS